ncbi:Small-conductance mechanosensitive channel [Sphingomonas gellani]|uniref:Small-conductance mechanosensitive channel n=1 Tax=Sphingomonas gellani TaxID=1166340 RepID=A0A1H8C6D2_9SPHN|nr:mechanosensitive ion channel family protein [Sphingomonas gellani]SEM89994.1 Small-conductance mechanosensitive channel [Sphingomonas gellani]
MNNTVVAHVTPPPVLDPVSTVVATLHLWWNSFAKALPSIAGGIIFLLIAWVVGRLVARGVRRAFFHRDYADLGGVLGSIAFGFIMLTAVLVASVIVFPSVKPGTIISSLGIGSVAIGFAFKDILQNLLAGILLLINRPFRRGDQVIVKGFEGTVEHIQSRATLIKTYDGRRVIIPNSDIYTSAVTIHTAFPTVRSQIEVGIGYGDDPDHAMRVFRQAMAGVEGVEQDPGPDVLAVGFGDSTVTLRARWWTAPKVTIGIKAKVILAIRRAAQENGIDLPFPTTTVLFHDQTDEADGDRTRQREGWPAGNDPPRALRDVRVSPDRAAGLAQEDAPAA